MIVLPVIKNIFPLSVVTEMLSVQPMQIYDSKLNILKRYNGEKQPLQSSYRHSFLEGWERYYGTEWISEDLWWKVKISGF